MIKQIAALFLGLLSAVKPVIAQADQPASTDSERWILFDRVASDGMPLVVFSRTGNSQAEMLLIKGRATAVICRADPTNVGNWGMPQGTAPLYDLEDKIAEEPTLLAARAIHVASVTGQGQRRIFIVHPDPLDLTPFLEASQVQGFSCDAAEVEDRQALIQLITPKPLDIQLNGDRSVIASLQQNGDDGLIPRKTDFWFYGQRGSLEVLAASLAVHEFFVDHWLSGPDGVVLSREMPTGWPEFQEITPIIIDTAEHAGVEYDGWETMVISQQSTKPSDN